MIPINQFRSTLVLASVLIAAIASAQTDSRPRLADIADNTAKIGNGPAKAGGDTINLLGSHGDPTNEPGEPYFFGDFQDAEGNPAWNGWTSVDLTAPTVSHWNVSTYNQPDPENYAAWCGDIALPSCAGGATEHDDGYGNRWHDIKEFEGRGLAVRVNDFEKTSID